jgi:cytochrome oxidase Cu insertion factor (SCO1/SenC/PrrC family)
VNLRKLWTLVLPLCLLGTLSCSAPQPDDDYGSAGTFTLTERSGKTVSQADLQGKVWIASFVFTRCTGPCPQVSGTMARLQSELANYPDVRLVTFTVDPEHDDPGELKRYAGHFQADPERWLFLTGKQEDIYRLLREGFHVGVEQNSGEARKRGSEVMHSTKLVLVDRRGHIRGYFDGIRSTQSDNPDTEYEANLKRLREKVAALVKERS